MMDKKKYTLHFYVIVLKILNNTSIDGIIFNVNKNSIHLIY